MSRNDLPSEKSANFQARLRETLQTMLGIRGDKLDRVVTLRDLLTSGVFELREGATVGTGTVPLVPGPGMAGSEPDLTPPPSPATLTATGSISHVLIEVPPATYTQGNGHLRTRVYGANPTVLNPTPTFSDAVEVGQFSGTVWALASNPSTTWRLWAKYESNDNVLSASPVGGTNGVLAVTGQDVSSMVSAMTGTGNPFTILTTSTVIGGVTFPAGTYSTQAFIRDAQITNAKIANLAVDDAKIASLSAGKLVAGSIAVGEHIQATGYVAGTSGWRINGNGTAEFSGVVVRGTVFATAGEIGGIAIASNAVRAGQTAFNTGNGFHLGSDGRFSLGSALGNRLTWDGTNLNVIGGGTFSGALSAATGTFAGALSAATGTFAGALSAATGTFSGNLSAAGGSFAGSLSAATGTFSGTLTASAVNAVNTINLAGNSVSVAASASGTNAASTNLTIPSGVTATVYGISVGPYRGGNSGGVQSAAAHTLTINGTVFSTTAVRRVGVAESTFDWEGSTVAGQVSVAGPTTVTISTARDTTSSEATTVQLIAFARWK